MNRLVSAGIAASIILLSGGPSLSDGLKGTTIQARYNVTTCKLDGTDCTPHQANTNIYIDKNGSNIFDYSSNSAGTVFTSGVRHQGGPGELPQTWYVRGNSFVMVTDLNGQGSFTITITARGANCDVSFRKNYARAAAQMTVQSCRVIAGHVER